MTLRSIAGQGTHRRGIGKFLDEETAVVVPMGGGGLISGIAIAAKSICSGVKVLGVQTESCPSVVRLLEKKRTAAVR